MACFQPYRIPGVEPELSCPMILHWCPPLRTQKNGGCRDRTGNYPVLSLQPLSQVCVACTTLPDILSSSNGTKVGIPLSNKC
jgi:hypothetical protein